jgi:hypothetical protein
MGGNSVQVKVDVALSAHIELLGAPGSIEFGGDYDTNNSDSCQSSVNLIYETNGALPLGG